MANKPFAIQGADLTLGGVNLQAGTTGVVIPGVTQATSYTAEEVEILDDIDLNTTGHVIIDNNTYEQLVAGTYFDQGNTPAVYSVSGSETDGPVELLTEVRIDDPGPLTSAQYTAANQNFMWMNAFGQGGSYDFTQFNSTDWHQVPLRPKFRAGEVETIGGGNANTGDITFDGNTISVDGNYLQTRVQDGNDYSVMYQSSQEWEAYAENDEDGANGAWAWIRADLSDGINSPKVFIENVPADTGTAKRWSFDKDGVLTLPEGGDIRNSTGSSVLGGGGTSVTYREVYYPAGQEGDTAGTIAVNAAGNAYICIADYDNSSSQTFTVQESGSFDIAQTGSTMILTITDSTSDEEDVIALWANRETAIPTGWTISGSSLAVTHEATSIGIWDGGSQDGLRYITWLHRTGEPTTLSDGDEFTVTYTPGNRHIWTSITKANALEFINGGGITNNADDTNAGRYNIVADAEQDFVVITDEGTNEFRFTAAGGLKFPDGTTQTTAYTGQAGGGSGELYIMANVDGDIVTSTDGTTWGEPVPSGVPTFSTGGPYTAAIGKLAVHGGVIVYTRTDEANGEGIRASGLYYSTEIGTATLCSGTDADPGGDLYWNEVHFFSETDKWVAVGYRQYGEDSRFPIFAYSTDGISWTVKYVDSTFVTDHNIGNFSWELTDVAYNTADSVYVFVGKVGGPNYAGVFVTNNLDATFDADIWVDVPDMNARSIVSVPGAPSFGPPVSGVMIAINSGVQDVWTTFSPVSDSNNWFKDFNGPNDGWYQGSMIDAVGYVPNIAEIASNGSSVIITTWDGQVAVPTFGPSYMTVTVPLAYTSAINDIIRNDWTISTFDVSPILGTQNTNWNQVDNVFNVGDDSFHVVIDSGKNLITCDLTASGETHQVGDTITLLGGAFGGTNGVDDIVVTVTAVSIPRTTIVFTDHDIAHFDGEKIVITGVTSHTESGTTTEQSYNGTYYVKKNDTDYELYTDQACTISWDTHTYWPVDTNTGTLTWSHGQFFDAAGCSNSYYYIGNDDEQIFRSIDGGTTWVQQTDVTGGYFNDFAYGTWGSGASSSGTVTIESPFVTDFFGPEVYFVKDNYGSQVDNIDTNVAITRGDDGGIYNPITNPNFWDNQNGPTNTQWNMDGWADLSNVKTRSYDSWQNICSGGINTQYREFVMHDTENDKYYAIKFLTFQGGANGNTMGGGFSYIRRLINTDCWFNRADGDDSESVVDAVGPGLTIVRGQDSGIYNSADEGGWSEDVSPSGTLWNAEGWSDLTNVTTRQYLPFYQVTKHIIGRQVCGLEFVMKDTINNKYYAIKFSYWGHGGNGNGGSWPGVRYTRREIDLTKVSHNVKFADGSIQTTAITEQRLGVLPQKIVDSSQDRYLTLDDIGKHLLVTQSGTYLRINDSTRQEFPLGAVITIINKSGGTIYVYKDNDTESGTIYGSNQNANGNGWYIDDSGSGNMVTLIKIAQYYDGQPYSDWMIAGSGIGTD